LYLQASIIVAFLAASSAPTSLYAVYQARWGLTPITITIVFGIYALAVLAALLTVGSLSDYVGRRPVLLFAIVIQAAGLVLLSEANGLPELVIGRILQGVATGAAVGAVGAGIARSRPCEGHPCQCHYAVHGHCDGRSAVRTLR
jgi:MFS family permease